MADTDREGLPAISSCLCPCHIDGLITDADLKARLEAQCKCEAVTKYLAKAHGYTDLETDTPDPVDEADTAAYLETRDLFTPAEADDVCPYFPADDTHAHCDCPPD